jgi:hypothetical protein
MRIESTAFTDADYDAIVEGYFERERAELVVRLRRVAEETGALVPSLDAYVPSDEQAWNPMETLAHMGIAAQFFGWAIHEISNGKDIGPQMLELMNLRDPSMVDMLKNPPDALAQQLRDGIERVVAFLQEVPYDDLRNRVTFASRELSGEDFSRISLVHHLEDHLEQMRRGLDR